MGSDAPLTPEPEPTGFTPRSLARRRRIAFNLWIPAYLLALLWSRDQTPDGPNNDAVEEALRGLYLVGGRHLEVMTFSLGNSAETLYLYLTGLMASVIGPTTLALQLPSWGFAIATIALLIAVARRVESDLSPLVPMLLGTSSLWLFHFARAGARTITAPFFLLAFFALLMLAEKRTASAGRSAGVAAGAVLGLSLYSYTACRVIPIIFVVYAGIRLIMEPRERRDLLLCYGWVAAAALIVSIPNIAFLIRNPHEFLFRGSYALPGSAEGRMRALMWTALIPFRFPVGLTNGTAPEFVVDGITNGLVVAGLQPIHPVIAAAFVYGVVRAFPRRRDPVVLFLFTAWVLSVAALGMAGPGLGLLLIMLPIYLLFATIGAADLLRRFPADRSLSIAGLTALSVWQIYSYFSAFDRSEPARYFGSPVATPMGKRAAQLADQNRRVVCIVRKDASVVRYLTSAHMNDVRIAEFYFRPLVEAEVPLQQFHPDDILIEHAAEFAPFARSLPGNRADSSTVFEEIHLTPMPSRRPGR